MPSNILNTDVMFPQLTGGKSTEQTIYEVLNYLYMLREQLRYSLANLGIENINPTSFEEIANIITEPVYLQIKDEEGNMASLIAEVDSLSSRLTDTEGNVSSLVQTTTSLSTRMTDAEGNIGTLQVTATSLQTSVSSLDGEVTKITQTVNGLELSVTNGEDSSVLRLMSGSAQLSSATIEITGMVTFYDLSHTGGEIKTVINGGNVSTGTISAINIEGCNITGSIFKTILSSSGNVGGEVKMYYINDVSDNYLAGGLRLDSDGGNGDAQYRLFLYTENVLGENFALKLLAAGAMSLESGSDIYIIANGSGEVSISASTIRLIGQVLVNGSPIQ